MGSSKHSNTDKIEEPPMGVPISLNSFLELVAHSQRPNIKSRSDIISCVKGSSHRKREKSPTSVARHGSVDGDKNGKNRARFAVNEQNGKVWVMVKRIDLVDESLVDDLWWTDDDMTTRNDKDNDMANYVERHYVGVLQAAYDSACHGSKNNKNESDHKTSGKKTSQDIELDFQQMKKLGAARGLESLVNPEIQKTVRKHRKAVLGAQQILREHGRDLFEDRSLHLIAKSSIKYSQSSRLVSKKMGQFDNEAGQYGFKSRGGSEDELNLGEQ